jgi:hypothetical protein
MCLRYRQALARNQVSLAQALEQLEDPSYSRPNSDPWLRPLPWLGISRRRPLLGSCLNWTRSRSKMERSPIWPAGPHHPPILSCSNFGEVLRSWARYPVLLCLPSTLICNPVLSFSIFSFLSDASISPSLPAHRYSIPSTALTDGRTLCPALLCLHDH